MRCSIRIFQALLGSSLDFSLWRHCRRVYLFAWRRLSARRPCVLHFLVGIVIFYEGAYIADFFLYLLSFARRSFYVTFARQARDDDALRGQPHFHVPRVDVSETLVALLCAVAHEIMSLTAFFAQLTSLVT